MRQFNALGKTFEQQCVQVKRGLAAHAVLAAMASHGQLLSHRLVELALTRSLGHSTPVFAALFEERTHALVKIAATIAGFPSADEDGDETDFGIDPPVVETLCTAVYPAFEFEETESKWDWKQFFPIARTTALMDAIQRAACAVMRSPIDGKERRQWIKLSRQCFRYKQIVRKWHAELVQTPDFPTENPWADAAAAAAEDAETDADADEWEDERAEAFEDFDALQFPPEEDEDEDEDEEDAAAALAALAAAALAAAALAAAPVPATAVPVLAAFASDRQNVHTAPAREGTERVIAVLLPRAPSVVDELIETYDGRGFLTKRQLYRFREHLAHDGPHHIPHSGSTTKAVTYKELFDAAWSLYKTSTGERASGIFDDILYAISLGEIAPPINRVYDMAAVVCKWNPEIRDSLNNPLYAWIEHSLNQTPLLHSLHQAWATALAEGPGPHGWDVYPEWSLVLETAAWEELKRDVAEVENFGVRYSKLLNSVWAYAVSRPTAAFKEIAIRLAEEVLDGRGMCEQGKMTRLANVLRGFHPALEDVPVLSVGEQLQNRMSVISLMPEGERVAAAEAVFGELGVNAEIRAIWLSAVMDA